ncbi:MAG: hypothetical protein E3J64_03305 [Anaerolineales bacterium]|nr:MAG: hypothetical protein E3J64_03305 [Anaerolineales bacterium]
MHSSGGKTGNRAVLCLIALAAAVVVACGVRYARQQALSQTTTISYAATPAEAEWAGNWEFSELGADPSEAGGDSVTIAFSGTDFALRVRRGAYRAYVYVSIDGKAANLLPQDERGAYLVLTSPDETVQVETLPVASHLDDGAHVAVVDAERGWDQWPLVGWSVSQTPQTGLYDWVLTGLGAVAVACLIGAIWWGRLAWMDVAAPASRTETAAPSFVAPWGGDGKLILSLTVVATAAFYFSPWAWLALICLAALAVLVIIRLDAGLALVAATAPFYLQPVALFGRAFSVVETATLLCLASWALRQVFAWRRRHAFPWRRATTLDIAVVLFVATAIASLFVAEQSHVALRELRVLILEPALFFLMLRTSRLRSRQVWRLVDSLVLGGLLVASIGLVQYALGTDIITAEEGFRRLVSIYGSPNSVGLYMGRILPILLAVALLGASRRRRVVYGIVAFPIAATLILSFSKGALLLGAPLSLLALGLLAGGRWLRASLVALVGGAVAAIPLLNTPRFRSLLDTRGGTTFFRIHIWRSSWTMFSDHPWLGVGPDNFLYQYRSRYILPAAWQEPNISQAHNVLLDYATRMGIPGIIAGVWLQCEFWRMALPLRRLRNADHRALAIGLMASMGGFLAHGLVDASYFLIDLAFAFFLTLGLVQWLARSETNA